jgi:arginine decarboxylase
MSMNHPWILCVTSDLPDEGSAFRLALTRLGKAIEVLKW